MRLIVIGLLVGLLFQGVLQASEGERHFYTRILHLFNFSKYESPEKPVIKKTKYLKITLQISPVKIKLPETRQMKVSFDLTNRSGKYVRLEFPTSQRIEAVLREKNGPVLVQWSEDQSFATERGFVMINPGEHVEYLAMLPTRDLVPGRSYEIEVSMPGYRELIANKTFVPVE